MSCGCNSKKSINSSSSVRNTRIQTVLNDLKRKENSVAYNKKGQLTKRINGTNIPYLDEFGPQIKFTSLTATISANPSVSFSHRPIKNIQTFNSKHTQIYNETINNPMIQLFSDDLQVPIIKLKRALEESNKIKKNSQMIQKAMKLST